MPRARSSGALSILSNDVNFAVPFEPAIARTLVIAAVSVVLPWSTCPIVPTFTCGLVLSNLPLDMVGFLPCVTLILWCRWCGLNARPLPYQGSALPLSYNGGVRFDNLASQETWSG